MSRVGLEPTFPVFERAKTIHVLDLAATVIGSRDRPGLVVRMDVWTDGRIWFRTRALVLAKLILITLRYIFAFQYRLLLQPPKLRGL
jgi:hypothetical protein